MSQRFDELYIRRCEHQQIIAFYKKLVVKMYRKLREMQAGNEAASGVDIPAVGSAPPSAFAAGQAPNVVRVDFHRRAKAAPGLEG
ncbi:MAG: hypothetical protein WA980_08455 [Shinella zoogloeoides]|uniref:hypothetical protein n=1 Tax=Shinella zoogloeoides TaxID=352475 RepID=UPI003C781984